jgi:hypothetical protein
MSLLSRQSLQNKQCFHNLYAYLSAARNRYEMVRNATLGIIFFGTPHRGSDKAVYSKVLANVAQTMTRKPPAGLLSALQTNSDVLLRLTSDFRFQLP